MKIVRVDSRVDDITYGAVEPEGIRLHLGSPFVAWEPTETVVAWDEVKLLAQQKELVHERDLAVFIDVDELEGIGVDQGRGGAHDPHQLVGEAALELARRARVHESG